MNHAAALVLAAVSFLAVRPAETPPRAAVIVAAVADMYSRASAEADVVSQAVLGTNVKILAAEKAPAGEAWYKVETPDTYTGFVTAASLRTLPEGGRPYASSGRVFEVTSLFANVYATADVTERKPLLASPLGTRLEVGPIAKRWGQTTLPDGRTGWVQDGDGMLVDAAAPRPRLAAEGLVSLAKKFLGLPYLWGGTSSYGLDCSGFVQLVYRLGGIDILRDADIQFEGSGLLPVPPGEEGAADLVFFGRVKGKITHVGMMIDGESFIHATTHERPVVQVSRLRDAYWQGLYQGARRPAK
jgi:cell wall-associated NlpC family hydrolase